MIHRASDLIQGSPCIPELQGLVCVIYMGVSLLHNWTKHPQCLQEDKVLSEHIYYSPLPWSFTVTQSTSHEKVEEFSWTVAPRMLWIDQSKGMMSGLHCDHYSKAFSKFLSQFLQEFGLLEMDSRSSSHQVLSVYRPARNPGMSSVL